MQRGPIMNQLHWQDVFNRVSALINGTQYNAMDDMKHVIIKADDDFDTNRRYEG